MRCSELLIVSMGGALPATLSNHLKQSDPEQLAQLANQHHVHCILYSAFTNHPELKQAIPHDLLVYFELMNSANAARNREAKEELTLLGKLFDQAGIKAIILKGGAEIVAPYYHDPSHRFISDLDILIPENKMKEAAEILFSRGGTSHPDDEYHLRDHHHLPGIEGGDLPFRIELHKHIGDGKTSEVLSAREIFKRAVSSNIEGIFIPSPEHRFTHHLLHGQLRSQLYARTLLNLRNCVDHLTFQQALDEDSIDHTRLKFDEHGLLAMLNSMDALSHLIFEHPLNHSEAKTNKWASKTLRHFGQPRTQKYIDSFIWIKGYIIRFFTEPQRRRHYLRRLFSARGWVEFVAFHKDRLQRFM